MKQEDKELLLRDLCARLPYKVKASFYGAEEEMECFDEVYSITDDYVEIGQYILPIEAIKPYLFPLSSMSDEQKVIYGDLCYAVIHSLAWDMQAALNELVDWLNKNNFDYRGFIEKGLALDASGLNIY